MARKARATLMEIAKAAGVSATTVSNVVNGRLQLMSEDTRRRVERIIQQENYRPNEEARSLRLSQRRTIGLMVVGDSPTFLADPMITNIVAGMSNYLGVNGYGLLITGITHAAVESAQMMRRDQTDGICLFPSGPIGERRRLFNLLRQLGQPVVVFQDHVPDDLPDAVAIRQDDRRAGRLVAERLFERGARRIAFVSPAESWSAMVEREAGVREVAKAKRLSLDTVISATEGVADTKTAIERYSERAGLPDAVIGGNDQMAIAAMNWALDRNLRVPHDLKVAGFNGFAFSDLARPPLTTVLSPAYDIGLRGAELMVRRLKQGRFGGRDVVFDVELRASGSD
jgi:LacI family transcriptional regulator